MNSNIYTHIREVSSTFYSKMMGESKNSIEFKRKQLLLADMIEKRIEETAIVTPIVYMNFGDS